MVIFNRRYWVLWVLAIGLVLRVLFLTSNPLWYDETFTLLVARLPLDRLILATAGDVHPPLYYLLVFALLHAFPTVDPVVVLRGFSVITSMLALVTFWGITGELGIKPNARLISLALMAILPIEIYYAQEARMYSLLQYLVLTQWLLMLRRDWKALTLVTILALYTHNYGGIYALIIYGIALAREDQWTKPFISGAAAALTFVPWLMVLASQMQMVAVNYWLPPVTISSTVYSLFQLTQTTLMHPAVVWIAAASLGMLVVMVLADSWQNRRWALIGLAFGPLVIAVCVSLVWNPILLFRSMIASVPVIILLAVLAAQTRRDWFWTGAQLLVIGLTLVTLLGANIDGTAKRTTREVLSFTPIPDRVVVHMNDGTLLPYLVYYPELTHLLINPECGGDPGILTPQTHEALGITIVTQADLVGKDYMLAGIVGPLSTACEERTINRLTQHAQQLAGQPLPIGISGVWYVKHE